MRKMLRSMENAPEWSQLVKAKLLSSEAVRGVAVLSGPDCSCVYTQGLLQEHRQQDWSQFRGLFTVSNSVNEVIPRLSLDFDKKTTFIVFQKGQCSVYATSGGGMYSLVVCSFPLGLLVCVSQAPTLFTHTVTAVENFAMLLRQ